MHQLVRILTVVIAALGLAAADVAFAQPKDKDGKGHGGKPDKEQKEGKEKKQKEHKHKNGKDLLGEKVKQNGKHKVDASGKHTVYADVRDGKIAGMTVNHAEKGNVPVKKYKATKKMAGAASGLQPVSWQLAQSQYLGTTWIGYAYIDEWGDEVIYWYPYDMIYDGDTGAIEYLPAY